MFVYLGGNAERCDIDLTKPSNFQKKQNKTKIVLTNNSDLELLLLLLLLLLFDEFGRKVRRIRARNRPTRSETFNDSYIFLKRKRRNNEIVKPDPDSSSSSSSLSLSSSSSSSFKWRTFARNLICLLLNRHSNEQKKTLSQRRHLRHRYRHRRRRRRRHRVRRHRPPRSNTEAKFKNFHRVRKSENADFGVGGANRGVQRVKPLLLRRVRRRRQPPTFVRCFVFQSPQFFKSPQFCRIFTHENKTYVSPLTFNDYFFLTIFKQ